MTLDNCELLYVRISSEFLVISQIWETCTDEDRLVLSATEL